MLMPKKVKWRKQQKGRIKGMASGGFRLSFGDYGLQALEAGRISNRQIEAARIAINRHIKRGGKVWIRIFPDKPLTSKPAEVRMGKGKGSPEKWVAVVKPGISTKETNLGKEKIPYCPGKGQNRHILKKPV